MKNFSIISLFLFITLVCDSQSDYLNGYIINKQNDTTFGKVKDRVTGPFGKLYKKIRFKKNKGLAKRYTAYDLKEYKKGEEIYISMWFCESNDLFINRSQSKEGCGERRFLKLVYKDYLSYYFLEYEDEDGIDSKGFFKRLDEDEMVFVRTGLFGLNKKRMITYFRDCPKLQKMIENKEIKDPYEILSYYNNWNRK